MTKLFDLQLLFNQFSSLLDEMDDLIENNYYDELQLKIIQSNKLLDRIVLAKKTLVLKDDEKDELSNLEWSLLKKHQEKLNFYKERKSELEIEIKNSGKKVKVSSAYDSVSKTSSGRLIDISE